MHGGIIMINRVCSYCGSNTGYDNDKESNGYWYSLVTRDNKTCLYFLCSNCYAKQTDKNSEWNPIINTKSQNRKELEHKTKNFYHNPILRSIRSFSHPIMKNTFVRNMAIGKNIF